MPCSPGDTALITRIQKYSTKDGPGIRSTVFLKGCPLACRWCANPEAISKSPEFFVHSERCISCGKCLHNCPEGAIREKEGKYHIDRSLCTMCGRCAEVCPANVYEQAGRLYTVEKLVYELLKDKVFYDTSGGGVTFSGGEPLLNPGFVKSAAKKLKESHVHIALETAGHVKWGIFESLLEVVDLVLLDIKFFDPQSHKKYTGVSNALIMDNAQKLSLLSVPVTFRLIYVPGINDGEDIRKRILFAKQLGNVRQIDILKYHKLGIGKYHMLGIEYTLEDIDEPADEQLQDVVQFAKEQGFSVTIGG